MQVRLSFFNTPAFALVSITHTEAAHLFPRPARVWPFVQNYHPAPIAELPTANPEAAMVLAGTSIPEPEVLAQHSAPIAELPAADIEDPIHHSTTVPARPSR
jgi:hypothetical protein